jgi:hypothetical protein
VVDAEIVLARDRDGVVGDGVQQPQVWIVLGLLVGEDRGLPTLLLPVQAQVQARRASADDRDALAHAHELRPPCDVLHLGEVAELGRRAGGGLAEPPAGWTFPEDGRLVC